ncbi:hypothetical protein IAG44_15745 [Streptomyces roseirectus]|uniref:DUF11 domain-containing protein n=1 Tax=Streptomyces roseirectus TaxID=2768066 RepID=A0A7H0ID76_9ACTN|nr:hypothetical protein [Streptomyces roseirectus]QNP70742.1 hypothetical protein IAG44_15745 [Streptomyces roseirectus]
MRRGLGVVRGLAVGVVAVLVGGVGVTGAGAETASPSPSASPEGRVVGPVDVRASLSAPPGDVAPAQRVFLAVGADVVSGAPEKLSLVVRLPAGLEYVSSLEDPAETKECVNAPDKRSVTCTSQSSPARPLAYRLQVIVGSHLKPGTDLPVTVTAATGDEPDTHPADNTASTTLQVRRGADFGVEWVSPKTSVKPGESVTTKLVVTNHSDRTTWGPGGVEMSTLANDYRLWPYEQPPPPCWADSYHLICEWEKAFAPGESRTYVMKWRFPKESAGRTVRASAETLFDDPEDPVPGNDEDELVFKVAKLPGGAKPSPSPTPTPTPSPEVSSSASASASASAPSVAGGGGNLAETGAGVGPGMLGWAVGLVVVGGGLFGLVLGWRRGWGR